MTQQRGHGFQENPIKPTKTGNTYLLVVAIDKYKHNWPDLVFPVRECEQLIKVLTERYGVILDPNVGGYLKNDSATLENVFEMLGRLQEKKPEKDEYWIGTDDNLILVFSCHGYQNPYSSGRRGFLAMVDSNVPNYKKYNAHKDLLDTYDLFEILSQVHAKNILVIVDSCFSSSFSNIHIDLLDTLRPKKGKKSANNPSRWIMTSGRDEPVPDESLFANALIEKLNENKDPDLSIRGLFSKIEEQLTPIPCPNPLLDDLVSKEFNGGEFRFHLSMPAMGRAAPNSQKGDLKRNQLALAQTLRLGSLKYKEQLENGRFKHLDIANLLLAETNHSAMDEAIVSMDNNLSPLSKAVTSLWDKKEKHVLLIGSGGMGKTVSLLKLWREFLEDDGLPIPLFIALNEFNQVIREEDKARFILRYIADHYLGNINLTPDVENSLWELFAKENGTRSPGVVLLLDGYNEVTANNDRLIYELNKFASEAKNVQLIVSSRYAEIQQNHWARSSKQVDLVPLSTERIEGYLTATMGSIPDNPDLLILLGNPMMLAIYASTDLIITKYSNDSRYTFYPVQTVTELLWNYQEAHLAKNMEALEGNRKEQVYVTFLIRYVVPFLAWRMEKEGQFFVSTYLPKNNTFKFKDLLSEALEYLKQEGALSVFPECTDLDERLSVENKLSGFEKIRRSRMIQKMLVNHLHIMVAEGNDLRFLHQNFRDFYAACHLRNCILFSMAVDSRPMEWKERVIPVYLRKMLGEIEGEYLFDPYALLDGAVVPGRITNNLISKLLDACRGQDMDEDYTVWNLVTILDESRNSLAGINLNGIDLRNCRLKNLVFSVFSGTKYLSACLNEAKINGSQFLNHEIEGKIIKVLSSPVAENILVALQFKDGYAIRELSINIGHLVREYRSHEGEIISLRYNKTGNKILSWDTTGRITEWNEDDCAPTPTAVVKEGKILNVIYNKSESRIISSSDGGLIQEWEISTKICIFKKFISTNFSDIMYTNDESHVYLSNWFTVSLLSCLDLSINDLKINQILNTKFNNYNIIHTHFLNLNEFILVLSNAIIIYSLIKNQIIYLIKNPFSSYINKYTVTFSELLNELAFYFKEEKVLFLFDINKKSFIKKLKIKEKLNDIAYSLDGKLFLGFNDDSVITLSANNGLVEAKFARSSPQVSSAEYSSDGRRVIVSYEDHSFSEWSTKYNICLKKFFEPNGPVKSILYGQSNDNIVTFSNDLSIKQWDLNNGKCINKYAEYKIDISKAIFNYNFQKIFVIYNKQELGVFNLERKKIVEFNNIPSYRPVYRPFDSYDRVFFSEIAITSDQDKIIFGNNCGEIGELKSKNPKFFDRPNLYQYRNEYFNSLLDIEKKFNNFDYNEIINICGIDNGIFQNITSLYFRNDNKKLLSSSYNQIITEWNVENGLSVRSYLGNTSGVVFTCYNNEEDKVISLSECGEIRVWKIDTEKYICSDSIYSKSIFSDDLDNEFLFACYSKKLDTLLIIFKNQPIVEMLISEGKTSNKYYNISGAFFNGLDFRKVHTSSKFSEHEKNLLRRYGAIFTDEDEKIWKEALADAYGEDENN